MISIYNLFETTIRDKEGNVIERYHKVGNAEIRKKYWGSKKRGMELTKVDAHINRDKPDESHVKMSINPGDNGLSGHIDHLQSGKPGHGTRLMRVAARAAKKGNIENMHWLDHSKKDFYKKISNSQKPGSIMQVSPNDVLNRTQSRKKHNLKAN